MRIIPILGLLLFFNSYFIDNSRLALLIMINGVICHGIRTDTKKIHCLIQLFRIYDTICNIVMIGYTFYIAPSLMHYGIFSSTAFMIEMYLEQNNYRPQTIDVFHVALVQFPLSIGLNLSLK